MYSQILYKIAIVSFVASNYVIDPVSPCYQSTDPRSYRPVEAIELPTNRWNHFSIKQHQLIHNLRHQLIHTLFYWKLIFWGWYICTKKSILSHNNILISNNGDFMGILRGKVIRKLFYGCSIVQRLYICSEKHRVVLSNKQCIHPLLSQLQPKVSLEPRQRFPSIIR